MKHKLVSTWELLSSRRLDHTVGFNTQKSRNWFILKGNRNLTIKSWEVKQRVASVWGWYIFRKSQIKNLIKSTQGSKFYLMKDPWIWSLVFLSCILISSLSGIYSPPEFECRWLYIKWTSSGMNQRNPGTLVLALSLSNPLCLIEG